MGQRPPHLKPPAHLTPSPPLPKPDPAPLESQQEDPLGQSPTRYGDWERAGRCIDF